MNKTATMLEQLTDSIAPTTSCCGSARRLAGGDWVFAWGGGNNVITEETSTGTRVFTLQFPTGTLLYRAIPVPVGVLKRAALRAGMDAQHP